MPCAHFAAVRTVVDQDRIQHVHSNLQTPDSAQCQRDARSCAQVTRKADEGGGGGEGRVPSY